MSEVKRTLKERMDDRRTNFDIRLDTYAEMTGAWLIKSTPFVAQGASALTVGYAVYEGVSHWFSAHWVIAIALGLIVAWATEGVGFFAVSERDKTEAHNRRTSDPAKKLDEVKGNTYVNNSFWYVLIIVATFESVPSVINFAFVGTATLGEMLFRCGLLVFPFLSRLGAQLFAYRAVREAVDTTRDDQVIRSIETQLRIEEMRAKSQAKIEKMFEPKTSRTVATTNATKLATGGTSVSESFPASIQQPSVVVIDEAFRKRLVKYYRDHPGAKQEDVAAALGVSVSVISRETAALSEGIAAPLHAVKEGRRKVVTVNGGSEEYLAGFNG